MKTNDNHPAGSNRRPRALQLPERALSVAEPWAYLIAAGFKQIENRTWHTGYRGTIAIHASKSKHALHDEEMTAQLCSYPELFAAFDDDRIGDDTPLFAFGAIVGTAEIIDCVEFRDDETMNEDDRDEAAAAAFDRFNYLAEQFSPAPTMPVHLWATGPYCFMLANPRRFAHVIPCPGKLSLWSLTPELRAAIAEASRDCLDDPGQPAAIPKPAKADRRKSSAAAKKREKLTGGNRGPSGRL